METFLQLVAHDLYQKIGEGLGRTAVVFPNKRASLFFNECLAAESVHPIWAPAYISISDLFEQLSELQKGDPIRLVCELYKVFREETKTLETLDDFYFWGELLISDFDDVDKNLVNADRLFANLKDLKEIMDDYTFLDKEQEEAIHHFFQNFSLEKRTELKQRFVLLWNKLGDIYRHYRERLRTLGIAYEGMLYRDVMENLDMTRLPYDYYVFVGFNVLNKVETLFFQRLQDAGRALFYWDYDTFYVSSAFEKHSEYTNEAGEFILRNLKQFPNQLPETCFDKMRSFKQVRLISAPTENAQARWLYGALATLPEIDKNTGVVLCNESLLLSVLHSLPGNVRDVNITMGFPLRQTPVYSLVQALMELQTDGYDSHEGHYLYETVLAVLRHPYVRQLSEAAEKLESQLIRKNRFYPLPSELKQDTFLELLFSPVMGLSGLCRYMLEVLQKVSVLYRQTEESNNMDFLEQLYRESLFKCYTLINRLLRLIENEELSGLKMNTLRRLLDRLLVSAAIPFHGEPVVGMQIMGVLETRNLDFKNLFVLSVNEGQLPKGGNETSFIPYNLRKAFGMTTIEHKNAVYAYYFYRLLQRAENVTLMYNTSSGGLNRGEMSRFLLQLMVEYPHDIVHEYLEAGQSPQAKRDICIPKTPAIMKRLYQSYDIRTNEEALFSPSALNTYLDCKLKFYYRYVAHLKAPEDVTAEIDSALFGSIFHRAVELLYRELTANSKEIRKDDLELLLKNEIKLQSYVDRAFNEIFFHSGTDESPKYNGTQLIHSKVINSYLKQLLRNDLQYVPFSMEAMEKQICEVVDIDTPSGKMQVRIGGTVDRMDAKGNTLRIVDYKTGGSPKVPENLVQLFTPGKDRPGYIFQTFLYASIMCRKQHLQVAPSLLYIHRASSLSYSPVIEMGEARKRIQVNDFSVYEKDFREKLLELLDEIFNPAIPFNQVKDTALCEFCDFRRLCKR